MKLRCPTCSKEFDTAETQAMPFCGERCRNIDLGRWLSEENSLPHEATDDGPESEGND